MNPLQGNRIRLRPIEMEDLEAIYTWENDARHWEASNHLNPISRFYLEQYILNAENNIYTDKQLRLMIEDAEGNTAGIIDLFNFEPHHRRAAVGIIIGEDHQKQGYASEALVLIKEYAKSVLHLRQLYCSIGTENEHSIRLFKKQGFEITGTRISWRLHNNKWKDEHFMQLIL